MTVSAKERVAVVRRRGRGRSIPPVRRVIRARSGARRGEVSSLDLDKEIPINGPIGNIIRWGREAAGMTQEQLASEAGCHPSTITRREADMNPSGTWGWTRINHAILRVLSKDMVIRSK